MTHDSHILTTVVNSGISTEMIFGYKIKTLFNNKHISNIDILFNKDLTKHTIKYEKFNKKSKPIKNKVDILVFDTCEISTIKFSYYPKYIKIVNSIVKEIVFKLIDEKENDDDKLINDFICLKKNLRCIDRGICCNRENDIPETLSEYKDRLFNLQYGSLRRVINYDNILYAINRKPTYYLQELTTYSICPKYINEYTSLNILFNCKIIKYIESNEEDDDEEDEDEEDYYKYYEEIENIYYEYNSFYKSSCYNKSLVNFIMSEIKEELISKVCSPKRVLNWDDDVLLNKNNILYGFTQEQINELIN
jgi:hypothetical protein